VFEGIAILRDFEERIARDGHVAGNPFAVVQLHNYLTRNEIGLGVDDLPFSSCRIDYSPKFIALIAFLSYGDHL
jgi:hypothetical protein